MPTVRISGSTWERLKRWAEPLEDSADDVINKVLNAAEKQGAGFLPSAAPSPKAATPIIETVKGDDDMSGLKTSEYYLPILRVLRALGSAAEKVKVEEVLEEKIKGQLTSYDYEPVGEGIPRWRKKAEWARYQLAHDRGLLKTNSISGIWELTDKGKQAAETGTL